MIDPALRKRLRLPLMIGGRSDAALQRVARHAAIWQTTSVPVGEFPTYAAKIRGYPGGERVEVGAVLAFDGNLAAAQAAVDEWTAAGAQHLSVNFGPADGRLERMKAFAREFC